MISHATPAALLLYSVISITCAQAETDPIGLEEVLVTASKVGTQDLQQLPTAITALSADTLADAQIKDLADLGGWVPNFTVSRNSLGGQLYIRGVGTNYIFVGGDPSVTTHIDGVYLGRPTSVYSEVLAADRIEVLRGPQGTLYGRNATGGTVNIISRKPGRELDADATIDLGSDNKQRLLAYASTPLSSTLAANIAVSHQSRDGAVKNIGPSRQSQGLDELNDIDSKALRLGVDWQPSDSVQLLIAADYFERDETAPAYKPTHIRELAESEGGTTVIPGAQSISDSWTVSLNGGSALEEDNGGISATVYWQFSDDWRLTSISAYREANADLGGDTDHTELAITETRFKDRQHQSSQELQLLWQRAQFSWVNGLYYFKEQADSDSTVAVGPLVIDAVNNDVRVTTTSYALYSDLTVNIAADWRLIAGTRYSDEQKEFNGSLINPATSTRVDRDDSWDNLSGRLGLQWDYRDDHMLYLLLSQGFKSGGYNFTSDRSAYDEELVDAIELGSKIDLPSIRSRLNAAAFYYDYRDLQLNKFVEAGVLAIENAADADIYGLELEWQSQPFERWRISGSLAWLDTSYGDYVTGRTSIVPGAPAIPEDVSGNSLNSAPEWSFNAVSDLAFQLGRQQFSWQLNYHWQDSVYFTPFNDRSSSQSSYALINTSLAYIAPSQRWQLRAYVNNLEDKAYTNASQDFSSAGIALAINDPRSYGLEYRLKL